MDTRYTERLTLRAFQESDLTAFFDYARDPDVGPAAGWKPHNNREESARILQDFIIKREVWAITDRADGRLLGSIGLHPDKKRSNSRASMLGFALAKPAWGQGLAVEAVQAVLTVAFEKQNLDILSVCHYPFNLRSRRVIEKCGFRYEGTLRMASIRFDGSVYDDVCYSMTREEYTALRHLRT